MLLFVLSKLEAILTNLMVGFIFKGSAKRPVEAGVR